MTKATLDILRKQAQYDQNAKVLLDRILKGLPVQGGKAIAVKD